MNRRRSSLRSSGTMRFNDYFRLAALTVFLFYSDRLHNYRCSVYAANAVVPVCAQFILSDVPHEAVFKFLRNCELSFLLATNRHYHQLVTNSTVLCERRLVDCTERIVAELQSNASSSSLHVCFDSLHGTGSSGESD